MSGEESAKILVLRKKGETSSHISPSPKSKPSDSDDTAIPNPPVIPREPKVPLSKQDFIAICGRITFLIITITGIWYIINSINWPPTPEKPSENRSDSSQETINIVKENNDSKFKKLKTSLPNTGTLNMGGSTTMVKLMKEWTGFYKEKYKSKVTYESEGSEIGLRNLIDKKVEIAASSRKLTTDEERKDLIQFKVGRDAIAVVVSKKNPFKKSLTKAQLRDIYLGQIKKWSDIDRSLVDINDPPIIAIHRGDNSGTRKDFQNIIIGQELIGSGLNVLVWQADETTDLVKCLNGEDVPNKPKKNDGTTFRCDIDGINGISYATVTQSRPQEKEFVRIISIDGVQPEDENIKSGKYPIIRDIFLVVRKETSENAKKFIEFALSYDGQKILEELKEDDGTKIGFIPIKYIK